MADVITTLHPEGASEDNLFPNIKKENLPLDLQNLLDFVERQRSLRKNITNGTQWNTGIDINASGGGGTILVLYSNNTSSGDDTNSEVGVIRLGYSGNYATYYSIWKTNDTYNFSRQINLSASSEGKLVLTGVGTLQNNVTLIYGK